MTHEQIDSTLLLLLPGCFEEDGKREPATLAELEDSVLHFVLGRLHALLRHGVRSGALHLTGRTYELIDPAKLAAPDDDSNVVHVENWGFRKPHLMAGPDTAEVIEFPARPQPMRRPPGDDTPEAG